MSVLSKHNFYTKPSYFLLPASLYCASATKSLPLSRWKNTENMHEMLFEYFELFTCICVENSAGFSFNINVEFGEEEAKKLQKSAKKYESTHSHSLEL